MYSSPAGGRDKIAGNRKRLLSAGKSLYCLYPDDCLCIWRDSTAATASRQVRLSHGKCRCRKEEAHRLCMRMARRRGTRQATRYTKSTGGSYASQAQLPIQGLSAWHQPQPDPSASYAQASHLSLPPPTLCFTTVYHLSLLPVVFRRHAMRHVFCQLLYHHHQHSAN